MLRSMMQVYVNCSCDAVELYQKAFDAKLVTEYKDEDGSYLHAELDVYGQIIALSEARGKRVTDNTMQFCLHFGHDNIDKVEKAYDVLKEGAKITHPLGKCPYSPCMVDLTDRFGVRWCIFA
jgi:PhnB protein